MSTTLTVPARFRGPPQSGNGGYVSGVLSNALTRTTGYRGPVEATLRAPVPLDTPMEISVVGEGAIAMHAGETLIGEARPASLELSVPEPPSFAAALAAQGESPSFLTGVNHLIDGTGFHPICACCGADLAPEAGLRVHAAPVGGFEGVAAAFRPDAAFFDSAGNLPAEVIWTALDCPGQFAWFVDGTRTGPLGRMTGEILKPVAGAQELRVTAWTVRQEGKKFFAGTALFDSDNTLCARSLQVWIGSRPPAGV